MESQIPGNEQGIIICDSFHSKREKLIDQQISEWMKNSQVTMGSKSKGYIRDNIYPALLFKRDEHSNILQVTDLICTSIQNALKEFDKSNPSVSIKENEDLLSELNPYLEAYWTLFEKGYGSVSGWGIKTWS